MTPEQLAEIAADARLSDGAVRMALYLCGHGGEWVELGRDDWRRLLHGSPGKDRIARDLSDLEHYGYIERRPGGKGHSDSFRFSVRGARTVNDSVRMERTVNPDSVRTARTLTDPSSSTTSSSPSAHVRVSGDDEVPDDDLPLARLRALLAPYDEPLDRLRRSTGTASWAADIFGWYRPPSEGDGGGTQFAFVFKDLAADEAIQALSTAIGDFASSGEAWSRQLFRGFARNAAREVRKAKAAMDREQAQETAAATRASTPAVPARLPPEEREWAERVSAALDQAVAADPALADWADGIEANLRKLHQDDRAFTSMRAGDQDEHIRIRVLNAYGQKIGDPRPNGRRAVGGAR